MDTKMPSGLVVNQALEILEFVGSTGSYVEFAPGKPDLNLRAVLRPALRAQVLAAFREAAETGQAKKTGIEYLVDSKIRRVDIEVCREGIPGDVRYRILFEKMGRSGPRAPRISAQRKRALPAQSDLDRLQRELAATRETFAAILAEEEGQHRAAQQESAAKQRFQELAAELELANAELEATAEELRAALAETQASEARLRESEERFARFMENLPGLAWIKDLRGRYVYTNQAAERAFQIPRPRIYGKTDAQIFPPETAEQFRENDRRAVASGAGIQTVETLKQEDGVHHSIVSKFPIIGSDGKPAMIGGVAFDITAWKLAEQSMLESEALFRTFATNAPTAIFIKDLEGRYTVANPLACQAMARPDGIVGFADGDLLPAADADMLRRHDLEVISTGRAIEREEVVRGRFFLSVKFPLLDGRGQPVGVCGVAVDITGRRQAEQDLRDSEQRLRLALDAGQMGTWEWSLETNQVVWSPGVEAIHGLQPGTFPGTFEAYSADIHPEDYDKVRDSITRALQDSEDHHIEYRIIWPDGSVHWLEARGKLLRNDAGTPVRMTGICADITARKLAESAIRESEQKFRFMADAAPVMIWISGADKRCTWFNRQWLEFVGRKLEQETGDGWVENIHPDDLDCYLKAYACAFDKRETFETEFRLRRRDGEYRWVLNNGIPLYEPERKFTGYIGSCMDITERKRAEQALREADRRKDEFLAMLGHELRNPLAAISTGTTLLQSNPPLERRSWIEQMMARQVKQLQRLVDDLLDVSRITRGKIELRKERIRLQTVLEASAAAVEGLMTQHGHQLSLAAPPQEISLEADPTRLEQVLVNLLANAAKYTPDGGRVWLSAEQTDEEVVIRCRDTGIGLSPEKMGAIFEPFVQFSPSQGQPATGLGMGLTLARELARMHGGGIEVDSAGPGTGSEFVVRLPALARHAPKAATPVRPASSSSPGRSFRILVVDDNQDLAESLALFLRGGGHEVSVAHDGETAIPIASHQRPEIVLLDIGLPGMDGYAVAKRLRAAPELGHALLVAISGRKALQEANAAPLPFDAYLVKPIVHEQLIALLHDRMAGQKPV